MASIEEAHTQNRPYPPDRPQQGLRLPYGPPQYPSTVNDHELRVHRVAGVAALVAGVAWSLDFVVIPIAWAMSDQRPSLGEVLQRLDGLCAVIEFVGLAVVAVAVYRDLRPATWVSRTALACASLGAVVSLAGLWVVATARGVPWFQAVATALAGTWRILIHASAIARKAYVALLAWLGIAMGTLFVLCAPEYLLLHTGFAWVVGTLLFPVWSTTFAGWQFIGPHPRPRQMAAGRPTGP